MQANTLTRREYKGKIYLRNNTYELKQDPNPNPDQDQDRDPKPAEDQAPGPKKNHSGFTTLLEGIDEF